VVCLITGSAAAPTGECDQAAYRSKINLSANGEEPST
jgi:hypothetical protein